MEKLGIIEFRETFFDLLDTITVSSSLHVEQESEFYEEIIFKSFDLYQRENSNYSISEIIKFFHIFLYATFKHKPSVEKDDDTIKLY